MMIMIMVMIVVFMMINDHGKEENGDGCVNGQYQHQPAVG